MTDLYQDKIFELDFRNVQIEIHRLLTSYI